MTRRMLALLFTFASGVIVGHVVIPSIGAHPAEVGVVMAQTQKPVFMTRLYTGPDHQTHAEEVELKFIPGIPGSPGEFSKMMQITGAEVHRNRNRNAGGSVDDWRPAPRRQYAITLSGRGEIEVAGGKKISVGPGSIDLVEDTTGKGHITRVIGTEDRVTLQLPLADQRPTQ
jgi:quercetin dioxygenase-like cupin family protein